MKRKFMTALSVAAVVAMTAAGCGGAQTGPADGSSAAGEGVPQVESVAEIKYENYHFDFTEDIAKEKAAVKMVPDAAAIGLSVADEKGATGVVLVPSVEEGNTSDYYLNAMVAGNALVFSGDIKSAKSSVGGDLEVADGKVSVVPATLMAQDPTDEIITFVMNDGAEYKVHTLNEKLPIFSVTDNGVAEEHAGVYTMDIDRFQLRVNTEGELVYYRNTDCTGNLVAAGFQKQKTADGDYYTFAMELCKEKANVNGGYNSAMFVVMDENFVEVDQVTLLPNDDPNHTHGEGYLDSHDFLVMGEDHYLTLSYTPLLVDNLPESVEGIDGGNTGYVWAGIFQEQKDGEVISEINTTDYPLLYESAVECIDYAGSTDQGVDVTVGQNVIFSPADGWQDYVHPNSVDYTLADDGTVDSLLVSMRDQSAVYQFDMKSGAIEWILGGKASSLTGYDEFTTDRVDQNGVGFKALTFGQHHARYTNKDANGQINGPIEISVFDNQTGDAPYLRALPVPTITRTFKATIDMEAKTAQIHDVIVGQDLDKHTDKYHSADHCASVEYHAEDSVVIGWGLHVIIDNLGPMVPQGTMSDIGFEDLRQGSRPIFSEYDPVDDEIDFELSCTRNPKSLAKGTMFSYRTYKTVD